MNSGKNMEIAIVGAGFAGICMGIRLKLAGFHQFTIFERDTQLGGTWRDNTYPGAACDVPSFLYSFSFAPKTDWTRKFAEQHEILQYLEDTARDFGILPHIRFDTEITEARFEKDAGLWRIETNRGEVFNANALVTGCGQLNTPSYPDIAGRDAFKGVQFHSARWNHEHDLSGKRVAVVGNGASALQIIPEIAKKTKQLYVFQRSAHWVIKKPDREYAEWEKKLFARIPLWRKLYRALIWAHFEMRWPMFFKNNIVSRLYQKKVERDIRRQVADPQLEEQLVPDYALGCKRILISNDYYDALQQDNVEVISNPIERITENTILSEDKRAFEVDTIVFATGFESQTFLAPMEVWGPAGRTLDEAWKGGAEAYLGICVSGFPNLFILYGPNTNLAHNSIIFMLECQVHYVVECLKTMSQKNFKCMDVRDDVMSTFNTKMQDDLRQTVWDTGCTSWYKTDTGKIVNNWAHSTTAYWWKTRKPDFTKFDIVPHEDQQHPPRELAQPARSS